jgi:hypothetical protein
MGSPRLVLGHRVPVTRFDPWVLIGALLIVAPWLLVLVVFVL